MRRLGRALEDRLELDEGAEALHLVEMDTRRLEDPELAPFRTVPCTPWRPASSARVEAPSPTRSRVYSLTRAPATSGRSYRISSALTARALRRAVRLLAELQAAVLDGEVRVDLVQPALVAGTGRASTFGDGGEVVAGSFVSTFVRGMPGSLPSRPAAVSETGLSQAPATARRKATRPLPRRGDARTVSPPAAEPVLT